MGRCQYQVGNPACSQLRRWSRERRTRKQQESAVQHCLGSGLHGCWEEKLSNYDQSDKGPPTIVSHCLIKFSSSFTDMGRGAGAEDVGNLGECQT